MGLAEIRDQIKTILETATGIDDTDLEIGPVYGYFRWVASWDKFKELFQDDNDKINGWIISRKATPEKLLTVGQNIRAHEWIIIGIYGVNDEDATELKFQDLIEGICLKFRAEKNLNDTCDKTYPEFGSMAGLGNIQVDVVGYKKFYGVLCHYCELRLGTQTRTDR